jgi:hypothetical protein
MGACEGEGLTVSVGIKYRLYAAAIGSPLSHWSGFSLGPLLMAISAEVLDASSKTSLSPFQKCSHRTLFPLAPLRQAALRSIPQRAITAVRSESSSLKGPATPRETVPALLSRTDSEFALRNCDHLRRPHLRSRLLRARTPTRKAGRAAADARIITLEKDWN